MKGDYSFRCIAPHAVAQKEHFDVYVKGKQAKPITPQVQEMMDYGTENEINAIVTLVGLILPALRPSCFSVFLSVFPV